MIVGVNEIDILKWKSMTLQADVPMFGTIINISDNSDN
jgi:hypothetical protein